MPSLPREIQLRKILLENVKLFTKKVSVVLCSGVDELLAQHVAHLFIRDPVSLFEEKIHQSVEDDVDHFEVSLSFY